MGWMLRLALVCLSQGQIGPNPTQDELSDLTRQTVILRSAGRVDQALETAKKALALANRLPNDTNSLETRSYLHTLTGILSDEKGIRGRQKYISSRPSNCKKPFPGTIAIPMLAHY